MFFSGKTRQGKTKMDQNGQKWTKMVQHGAKWCTMLQNAARQDRCYSRCSKPNKMECVQNKSEAYTSLMFLYYVKLVPTVQY